MIRKIKEKDRTQITELKKDLRKKIISQKTLLANNINKILLEKQIIDKQLNLSAPQHFRKYYLERIYPKIEIIVKDFERRDNHFLETIKKIKKEKEEHKKDILKDIDKKKVLESQHQKKIEELEIRIEELKRLIEQKHSNLKDIEETIKEIKKLLEKTSNTTESHIRQIKNKIGRKEFGAMKINHLEKEIKKWKKEVYFLEKEINSFNSKKKIILKIKRIIQEI